MTAKRELMKSFEHKSLPYGDDNRLKPGIVAVCGCCGAAIPLVVNTMQNAGSQSDEVEWKFIARKLEQRGWFVGRKVGEHRCPRCIEVARLSKVGVSTKLGEQLKMREDNMNTQATKPQPTFPPMREMKFADRRIINNKLDEVYEDEHVGYKDGWSDQRVATDLGVPLAWVKLLRSENYGDEVTSENVRERVKEASALVAKIKALEPAIDEARKLLSIADKMERTLADIAKVMR